MKIQNIHRNKIILFFLLFLFFTPVFSSQIYLKDGKIREGEILEENNSRIVIEVDGEESPILRRKILRIRHEDSIPERNKFNLTEDGMKAVRKQDLKGSRDGYIDGFLAGEDEKYYFIRRKLYTRKEIKIKKDFVTFTKNKRDAFLGHKGWTIIFGGALFFGSELHASNVPAAYLDGTAAATGAAGPDAAKRVTSFDVDLDSEPVLEFKILKHYKDFRFGLGFGLDYVPDHQPDFATEKSDGFTMTRLGVLLGHFIEISPDIDLMPGIGFWYASGTIEAMEDLNTAFGTSYETDWTAYLITIDLPFIFGNTKVRKFNVNFYIGPRLEINPYGEVKDFADIIRKNPSFAVIGGVNLTI
jgi:hypothetical protein